MLQPQEQGFQNISIVSNLRTEYENGNTILTFLEFAKGATGFEVVLPNVANDLKSEKHHFGIFNQGWIEFDDSSKKVIDVIKRVKSVALDQN